MTEPSRSPRSYDPTMLDGHPLQAVRPPSAELEAKLDAAGWPDDLVRRILALRRDRGELETWLDVGFPTPDMLQGWVADRELLLDTTLTARQATWEDSDLLAELCADAGEQIDDWSVTVERGPNPFAQFRLQERPNVIVLEDRRVGLGMGAHSVRNTFIEGRATTVHHMSAWRIRNGFRGLGLSRLLQNAAGSGAAWFGVISYWFTRSGNSSAGWLSKVVADREEQAAGLGVTPYRDVLTASVVQLGRPEQGRISTAVRHYADDDAAACRELINRTHHGLDLFRPYSEDFFDERMNDGGWGPRPSFYPSVYGRADYRVVERGGRIVACGGLWDRGRDLREIWQRGDRRLVADPAAVMDFGFAEGHEQAMAELLRHLLAEAGALGRSGLLAPLQHRPEVVALVQDLGPTVETRELHVLPFTTPELTVELSITRPYLDLAYW